MFHKAEISFDPCRGADRIRIYETEGLNWPSVQVDFIDVGDGTRWLQWDDIVVLSYRGLNKGLRFWQSVYNYLFALGQHGIGASWPEVVYYNGVGEHNAPKEFWERFEVIDGYLVPRDADSKVPEVVK